MSKHHLACPATHRPRRVLPMIEALDRRCMLTVTFAFNIIDPTNQFKAFTPDVQRMLTAAGNRWSTFLLGKNVTVNYDVHYIVSDNPAVLAQAGPVDFKKIRTVGGVDILQGYPANKIATGIDPNGSAAEGVVEINVTNLPDFFFDPSDTPGRLDPVPADKFDAYTIFLHELCHSLGFIAIRDDQTGAIPTEGETTYDQWINFDVMSQEFTFDGPNAVAVNPGPVSLSFGSISHVGNFGGTGQNLTDDLMSTAIGPGERREISALDRAMLLDAETPIIITVSNPPENGLLHIMGTNGNDHISLGLFNRTYIVRINGALQVDDMVSEDEISAIIIDGLGGNDLITLNAEAPACVINGDDGDDTIIGGAKSDTIDGGPGNDSLVGNGGNDFLRGGTGKDQIFGNGGFNRLFGEAGSDFIVGGPQNDEIVGGDGDDTLCGSGGNDFLVGDAGNDLLVGGTGKDRMNGGLGSDTFSGGTGVDTADYSLETDALFISIDNASNDGKTGEHDNVMSGVEYVLGGSASDVISGDENANYLIGGAGADTLTGNGGDDTIEGGGGNDRLSGSGGKDLINGGAGNDRIFGGPGADSLIGGSGNDIFYAIDGYSDSISGGPGTDTAHADPGDVIDDITTEIVLHS